MPFRIRVVEPMVQESVKSSSQSCRKKKGASINNLIDIVAICLILNGNGRFLSQMEDRSTLIFLPKTVGISRPLHIDSIIVLDGNGKLSSESAFK